MPTERPAQPCGGTTGYGYGKPVNPGQGRASGENWWHRNDECRRARGAWRKQATRQRKRVRVDG